MGNTDSDRHDAGRRPEPGPRSGASLVRRLTLLNLAVLTLTLVLTVLLIATLVWRSAVQRQTDAAQQAAGLLANSLASMVAFNDLQAMESELTSFAMRPDLVELQLFAADGRLLTQRRSGESAAQFGPFRAPEFEVRQTIEFKGEVLGRLVLRERLDILMRSMVWLSLTAALVSLLATVVAALVSRQVQRRALAPIVALGRLAEQVAAQQDYGLRAQVHRLDEVGRLTQRFNEMLVRVQMAQEQINQRLRLEQEAGQQFQQLAHHDSLTQLPNRLFFQGALSEMVSRSLAAKEPMALMFIDLDNFKYVNDNHGHDAGDEVLQVVARRMSAVLRRGDLLCRLGGDEFALLLPGLQDEALAEHMAQRLIKSVREPLIVGGVQMPVGATVGLAFCPTDAQDAQSLLQAADAAMYAAKRAGKNCYRRVEHVQG